MLSANSGYIHMNFINIPKGVAAVLQFVDLGIPQEFVDRVEGVFEQIWLSTSEMEDAIKRTAEMEITNHLQQLIVSGETDNVTAYLVFPDRIVVLSRAELGSNVLLARCFPDWRKMCPTTHNLALARDQILLEAVKFPKFVLVNLCVIENFPIPRLNLSIGTLVSFLRKHQIADVTMIDMQMGQTVRDVAKECMCRRPDLIGMSVNFGQKEIALELLQMLHTKIPYPQPVMMVGNVIPTFSPQEFFDLFPSLIICTNEGEYTLADMAKYLKGDLAIDQVRGILRLDGESGKIIKKSSPPVDIRKVPTPALDSIRELAKYRGALTLEASRGCDYSACTFCPRQHKLSSWRPMPANQVLKQVDDLNLMSRTFGIKPHIFFADEEFIGELPDGSEAQRVIDIVDGIKERGNPIRFDIAVRADSVYDPRHDLNWNVRRLKMWKKCQEAGVDRVFIGVESGSRSQLKRFGKGTTPEQNIVALRMLSALGIDLRIGFVMFDQLMVGTDDLNDNMSFLERTDAIMNPITDQDLSLEELYDRLVNDREYVAARSAQQPVYSIVSYMLATMEVLINAPYAKMLMNTERSRGCTLLLNDGIPDTTMGRYTVDFLDKTVKVLSEWSQRWIDHNFGVMYAVKSLFKVAATDERDILRRFMVRHRELSHYLLRYLVYSLERVDSLSSAINANLKSFLERHSVLNEQNHGDPATGLENLINHCMDNWEKLMEHMVVELLEDTKQGRITDTSDARLRSAVEQWLNNRGNWRLINEYLVN